jgi:glycosyltransferase involved in cell wall biosynthesis
MRIALVTRRFPPLIGGAERVLSYLAPALASEGAEVTVLTSRLDGLAAEERRDGVRIVRLATSPLRFVGTWLYMRHLRRWLAENPVDLAYVSMLKHDAYVVVGMGQRRGFPVVLRPEGAGATGDVAWQAWGRGGRSIAARCKRADAFVAISAAVHEELITSGYDPTKIIDLPNGVPIPEVAWSPRPDWERSRRAVFVGRLAPEKGLHSLIEAWPIVLESFPEARLTLVGEGPARAGLAERIERLGLGSAIAMPGSSSDPGAILRESDLFVLPSREEGMSIALLEAMALGMPLVASAIPGNRKLISDGIHGRLAPPDDSNALARAIVAQWRNPAVAAEQGRAARRRVIDAYSIAAVARRHLDLFERLTGG